MTDPAGDPFAAFAATPGTTPALADAARITLTSALRYGQSLMAVQMRYQATILQAMTDQTMMHQKGATSVTEPRLAADDLRAYLREIGETAEREARRFQFELAQLAERIAHTADPGSSTTGPARSHRVKD